MNKANVRRLHARSGPNLSTDARIDCVADRVSLTLGISALIVDVAVPKKRSPEKWPAPIVRAPFFTATCLAAPNAKQFI
jgi:hypothetical protein